jgi:hypothetical protein
MARPTKTLACPRFLNYAFSHATSTQKAVTLETVYDWITVVIFAGLIVLYLQRSSLEEPRDSIWQYLGASVGCAVANYFGNEGHAILAWTVIAATLGYVFYALKPFDKQPR